MYSPAPREKKRTPWETYNDGMEQIRKAANFKNENKYVIDYNDDLDTFMCGKDTAEIYYNRVIEGVVIPGRKKPYTKRELELIIKSAKARGKQIDYGYYHSWQDYTDPAVKEDQEQWRKKAVKVAGAAAAGGGLLYVIYLAGPAAVAYVEYVATYYTASAAAGTTAGLFTGGVAAGAGTTGILTTLGGEIQEIISGKNYTKSAFRDLVKRINPKVSKKKTEELYKEYKESPWAVAVLLVQMAAEAENLGVTGSGEKVESGIDSRLLDELASSDVKCNIDDVVAITKTTDGKLVWLEKGNSKAGLEHIMQHADQFATKGISKEKIPDFIIHALKNGKVVGTQRTRTIYEVIYEGKLQRVAISVGNNGFIVGANPKSMPK